MEKIELVKKYFKDSDEIINKAMSKVSYLMISRGISQEEERKELLELRDKLIEDLKNEN